MAQQFFRATSGAVALTTGVAKHIIGIDNSTATAAANANIRIAVWNYSISFNGATTTAVPVAIRVLRTDPNTGTWSNATNAVIMDDEGPVETLTVNTRNTSTVAPTGLVVLRSFQLPQYQGYYEPTPRTDGKPHFTLKGNSQLTFEITATFAGSLSCTIDLLCEA